MHRPDDQPDDPTHTPSESRSSDLSSKALNESSELTAESAEGVEGVEALAPSHLVEVLHRYAKALHDRRKGIDQLNVYPVPDGDTGTNMTLTMQSVLAELKDAAHDDMNAFATALSRGAIMGARGNSGAILAQAFRGFAESIKEKSAVGPKDLAEALESARNAAYTSVLKPVEGTILTVVTAASEAAKRSAKEGKRLADQIQDASADATEALRRTPDLLPVLKQAGVVDAGGTGFIPLLDALKSVVTGEPMPVHAAEEAGSGVDFSHLGLHGAHAAYAAENRQETVGEKNLAELRYEVMFLLEDADDAQMDGFREGWGAHGDSIVVVGGDGLWNCHIHGDDIGAMIEFALDYGRPRSIRVTDLLEQSHTHLGDDESPAAPDEQEAISVIAVAAGEGLREAFLQSGASGVVSGGQSMNPSVRELVDAVEASPADHVMILPNNSNIIATSRHVSDLTEKTVTVMPTLNPAQGLSLLIHFDPWAEPEDVVQRMESAFDTIYFGAVTQAVRDAATDVGDVKKGQWMGFVGGDLCAINDHLDEVLQAVAEVLMENDPEILTVILGEDASEEVLKTWRDRVERDYPEVEVETIRGDQPLYPFYLSAE